MNGFHNGKHGKANDSIVSQTNHGLSNQWNLQVGLKMTHSELESIKLATQRGVHHSLTPSKKNQDEIMDHGLSFHP